MGGFLNGTITGTDPYLESGVTSIPAATKKLVYVRMKNSTSSTTGGIYFITTTDGNWNAAKAKNFVITANDPGYTLYTIDMGTVAGWAGTINQMRIDPEEGIGTGTFSIDYIRVGDNTGTTTYSVFPVVQAAKSSVTIIKNTIHYVVQSDAKVQFNLYTLNGRMIARKTVFARKGMHNLLWNNLKNSDASMRLLEFVIDGKTEGIVCLYIKQM
jgi:hypothetical protein